MLCEGRREAALLAPARHVRARRPGTRRHPWPCALEARTDTRQAFENSGGGHPLSTGVLWGRRSRRPPQPRRERWDWPGGLPGWRPAVLTFVTRRWDDADRAASELTEAQPRRRLPLGKTGSSRPPKRGTLKTPEATRPCRTRISRRAAPFLRSAAVPGAATLLVGRAHPSLVRTARTAPGW